MQDDLDLDTVCHACHTYRYHDAGNNGFWRDSCWWCGDLCYQRWNA